MNRKELCQLSGISEALLLNFEQNGILTNTSEEKEYTKEDSDLISVICVLSNAGLSNEEIYEYLLLEKEKAQVNILRKARRTVMNNIHEKQELIDRIDYILREKEK